MFSFFWQNSQKSSHLHEAPPLKNNDSPTNYFVDRITFGNNSNLRNCEFLKNVKIKFLNRIN